jgi:hypothetical protein
MGAYKQFLASDITVIPFEVNKSFSFSGSQLTGSDVSIDRYLGKNLSGLFNPLSDPTTGTIYPQYQRLVYDSVKELYYSNYLSSSYGSPATTQSLVPGATPEGDVFVGPTDSSGKYFNYNQTTLTFAKLFPTSSGEEIVAISIPSRLYGNYIQPSSFVFDYSSSFTVYDDGQGNLYSSASFSWISSSLQEFFYSESVNFVSFNEIIQITLGTSNPPAEYTFISASWLGTPGNTPFTLSGSGDRIQQIDNQGITYDPGSGVMISDNTVYDFLDPNPSKGPIELLFYSSSILNTIVTISADENIGNIVYPHGMAIFTNQNLPLSDITTLNNVTCSFSSSLTIYETQYKCTIRENEYTLTQNPSALADSEGNMYSFVTAPYFSPYVTTVGLYDDEQNLLAIGKLSQPLPTSPTTDTTIVINIDR